MLTFVFCMTGKNGKRSVKLLLWRGGEYSLHFGRNTPEYACRIAERE